jgi:hypothetical protein
MFVMTQGLTHDDHEHLALACQRNRMELRDLTDATAPVALADDLLAVITAAGVEPVVPVSAVRQHGAYAVQVQPALNGVQLLRGIQSGYNFVFASPLIPDRLTAFLAYLRDIAAPPATQILRLNGDGVLSTPAGSVTLDESEAAVLRLFGQRVNHIVSRRELADVSGADPLQVTRRLKMHFEVLGSGAHILNVPHMGYRLVGSVHAEA